MTVERFACDAIPPLGRRLDRDRDRRGDVLGGGEPHLLRDATERRVEDG
jgi:hypothetical protein